MTRSSLLPKTAVFEAEMMPGVALYDVSRLLPRVDPHPKYRPRPRGWRIKRVFVHHSGRLGADGYKGARASVVYVTRYRNFPGASYHFWVPFRPVVDDAGRSVVFRLAEDSYRAWHTGRQNAYALGLALQGNTTTRPMSPSQMQGLEALIKWNVERHDLDACDVSFHAEAGKFGGKAKSSCPGSSAETWIAGYRAGISSA